MRRMTPEKKRMVAGIVAAILIVIMILGMVAPFIYAGTFYF